MGAVGKTAGDLLDRCTLEVRAAGGAGLGTGVLVGPGHVLTCAHVVGERRRVDVAGRHPEVSGGAKIAQRGDPESADDLALLELDEPFHGRGVIRFAGWTRGERFATVGFPAAGREHARGEVDGTSRHHDWLQIEPTSRREIEPGFSGGAVWVEARRAAVGLVTHRAADGVAFAITAQQIRSFWPQLGSARAAARCEGLLSHVGRKLRRPEVRTAILGAAPEAAWRQAADRGPEELARELCLETEPDLLTGALCGAYCRLVEDDEARTAEGVFRVLMEALPASLLSRWGIEIPPGSQTDVHLELLNRVLAEFALAAGDDAPAEFHARPGRDDADMPRAINDVPRPGELGVDLEGDEAGQELAREVELKLAFDVGTTPESQRESERFMAALAARRHAGRRMLNRTKLEEIEHASAVPEGSWRQPILNVLNKRLARGTSSGRRLYLLAGRRDKALVAGLRRHLPELKIVTREAPPEQFEEADDLLESLSRAFYRRQTAERSTP